ncbi:MAG: hypothetical protein AVDCRST_MAG32-2698, partial [uncultured Nocardioides sp.]
DRRTTFARPSQTPRSRGSPSASPSGGERRRRLLLLRRHRFRAGSDRRLGGRHRHRVDPVRPAAL